MHRQRLLFIIPLLCCALAGCKKNNNSAKSAFYFWKSTLSVGSQQSILLKQTAENRLYLHFFDVKWDDRLHRPFPDALINFKQPVTGLKITPVIYLLNKTFENIGDDQLDSLALHCNALINHIAQKQQISYQQVQIDCDWTITTRDKYFAFLKRFKQLNQHSLEATIRLHQVKYSRQTGIPPVDKGILMFYNMGKVSADARVPNSIYNESDAAKYVSYLARYSLPLDVALPLFSWAIQIREGAVIHLYPQLNQSDLADGLNFELSHNSYRAKKSFFLKGIYIKENDIFKPEQIDANTVKNAADQLIRYLPKQQNRTIIYYELGNLNAHEFTDQTLRQISASF